MDIAKHCTRIDISAAGGGRFTVQLGGEVLLTSARDPEHEACRELLARGIRGRLETFVGGKHSMTFDIETAAASSVSDGAASPLRLMKWRPFDDRAPATSVSSRAVEPRTAKSFEPAA